MVETMVNAGWNRDIAIIVASLLGVMTLSTGALVFSIFSIWLERKVAGRIQDRVGPNRTGPFGTFQTFADIGKLLIKEDITPQGADRHIYNIAPLMALASVLLILAVIPFSSRLIGADLNVGVLYFVAVGSFATLAILLAGWGSNNKYALLGAFRVIAQLISYEVPMVFSLAVPVMLAGTMSMQGIVQGQNIAYIFVVPIAALIFFISQLAEVGRSPFDLLEAESEIVAGFNIEYSGFKFALFYAAEFIHSFVICLLSAVLFLGGWRFLNSGEPGYEVAGVIVLMGKAMLVYFLVMLIRNTTPRIRIDQMMGFNWKFLVPLSLVNLIVVAVLARFFVPDYAAAAAQAEAGGLAGFVAGIFGSGFIAELPRAIVLLIANIAIFAGANSLLRRYANAQRGKIDDLVIEQPREIMGERVTMPAGR